MSNKKIKKFSLLVYPPKCSVAEAMERRRPWRRRATRPSILLGILRSFNFIQGKIINIIECVRGTLSIPKGYLLLLFFLPVFVGCSVSFPKDEIEEILVNLCKDRFNIDIDVVIEGNTLGAEFTVESIFDETGLYVSPEAIEKIEDVILSLSRAALSTDADFDFLVLIARDKFIDGAGMKLIRNVDDIKKLLNGMMSRDDYISTLVVEYQIGDLSKVMGLLRDLVKDTTLFGEVELKREELVIEEVGMGYFLQKQIERRIEMALRDKEMSGRFYFKSIEGALEDLDEGGLDLAVQLNVKDSKGVALKGEERMELEILCKNIAEKTLSRYDFKDYDEIRIEIE